MDWLERVSGLLSAGGEPGCVLAVAQELLADEGGLAGLLTRFQQAGLGEQAASWLGQGDNLPISAEQVQAVLGQERLSALAGRHDLDAGVLSSQLALHIPLLVDQMSPNGQLEETCDVMLARGLSVLGHFLKR